MSPSLTMDALEINYRLKRAGLSQKAIACELGVSQSVVGNVIHNRITAFEVASYIARALGDKLRMNVKKIRVIDPQKVEEWTDSHEWNDYKEIGKGDGSYRQILRNEEEAKELEQENRMQKTEDVSARLITEYETRLKTEPNNPKLMRSLAELYTQKKQFDKAQVWYDRLKATDLGNDASLDQDIAKTKVRKMDFEAEQLDPTAPDFTERTAALQAEKLAFRLSECQQRVEKYPTDLAFRFELGTLYLQAGKIGEAIAEFQKAKNNPNKRIAAMNGLAQCFAKRKMNDLAAKTLQEALKEKLVFDDEKKELTYQLGCIFEAMSKKEDAIEQFKLIYETDIGYKDVAAKVDAYYAGQ